MFIILLLYALFTRKVAKINNMNFIDNFIKKAYLLILKQPCLRISFRCKMKGPVLNKVKLDIIKLSLIRLTDGKCFIFEILSSKTLTWKLSKAMFSFLFSLDCNSFISFLLYPHLFFQQPSKNIMPDSHYYIPTWLYNYWHY